MLHGIPDEFENSPELELRLLRQLLAPIDASLVGDLSLQPACEAVPVDDLLPTGWHHALWLAHARLERGGIVNGSLEVARPSMLLKFRISTNGTLKCSPSTLLVYEGFNAWQVKRMVEFLLSIPPQTLLRYLADLMRVYWWRRSVAMLQGKVIVLGPTEIQEACARVRPRA